jgi:7-cyano-7-deazaguanine synthase
VALALRVQQVSAGEVRALTVAYGQRAEQAEVRQAGQIAGDLGIEHQVVHLPFYADLDGGALLDRSRPLLEPTAADLERGGSLLEESARQVWVPNRNGVFLAVAAAIAEARGADEIVVGFNLEEAQTFADNSQAFVEASNAALAFSTRNQVRVRAPTAQMTKVEILRAALELGLSLAALWPCYHGGVEVCGKCESCARFWRASREAGVEIRDLPAGMGSD